MMDELNRRLSPTGNSSNVELTKSDTHSNSVELDPLTGTTNRSDYSRKFTERVQNDVEKLKNGSIHCHRYKLHESNENKTNLNQSSNLENGTDLTGSSRLSSLPSSSRLSRVPLNDSSSTRVRQFLDDDDDLTRSSSRLGRDSARVKVKDYEPIGAKLASELGIDVKSKPRSFNYEQDAKRRAHEILLKEIDDEDEKFRTLPAKDPFNYKAREQMFYADWDEKDLRYLSKDGRKE